MALGLGRGPKHGRQLQQEPPGGAEFDGPLPLPLPLPLPVVPALGFFPVATVGLADDAASTLPSGLRCTCLSDTLPYVPVAEPAAAVALPSLALFSCARAATFAAYGSANLLRSAKSAGSSEYKLQKGGLA